MPSDNETESGSSGNGGRAQQQRSAPSVAPTSSAATTQGESQSKQSRTRWLPSKVRWQLGDQSRCRNLGTRTPKKLGCFSDATKWQDMPRNVTDEDLLAMLPLSLEEGSGAEYCGLHGNLFRDVTMMAPTTPQDFLIKSGKVIDMEIRVQKNARLASRNFAERNY
ncbi:hypothetical protein BV898_19586 [Hypsibius exemplaris]|uniref:Uncharacterized protein n=1 Tax=Hypsibius exemplaris TaxID=2072580 RepID=A0A9X6NLQ9_HYPEX|nr:hypothetical protein BV898_19586 [Hypsibius exemplaris]